MNFSQGSAVIVRERLRFEPENGLACWCDLLRELPEQGACWDSSHLFLLKPEARFLPLFSSVDDGDLKLDSCLYSALSMMVTVSGGGARLASIHDAKGRGPRVPSPHAIRHA